MSLAHLPDWPPHCPSIDLLLAKYLLRWASPTQRAPKVRAQCAENYVPPLNQDPDTCMQW